MVHVKLSIQFPTEAILRQTPGGEGRWGSCVFHVNEDVGECDYWVVYDRPAEPEAAVCPPANVILITGEPPSVATYPTEFLAQFGRVVTCHEALDHPDVLIRQQGMPWHVGRRQREHVNVEWTKGYDELKSITTPQKTRTLSVICSTKKNTKGHRRRNRFVEALKRRLGDSVDLFGRGRTEVEDKWDALAPYEYTVALENCSHPHYWTEKIADAYLAEAFPFYFGCPNLEEYFPAESFRRIDLDDIEGSVEAIRSAVEEDVCAGAREALGAAKEAVLERYNLFALAAELCAGGVSGVRKEVCVAPPARRKGFFARLRERSAQRARKRSRRREIRRWFRTDGDHTLRLDYPLDKDSVVLDVGGFKGDWAAGIRERYGCTIHVFEPVPCFAREIRERFDGDARVVVHEVALANASGSMSMSVAGDESSFCQNGAGTVQVEVVRAADFIRENGMDRIDLMKLNIEGAEYDLLDHLIAEGLVGRIRDIQVQFHPFVPRAEARMKSIQEKLGRTHEPTYQYRFVWENWSLKDRPGPES
ncbi:MAG: FkbM family methyltransferase [Planctomycetota bacterium]|jgi:FkbM family methyltransferase